MRFSLALAAALLGASAMPAHAYLDAGTGSMILQLLLGGLAGMAIVGKFYWHKFLGFFGMAPKESPVEDEDEERSRAKIDA